MGCTNSTSTKSESGNSVKSNHSGKISDTDHPHELHRRDSRGSLSASIPEHERSRSIYTGNRKN